MADDLHSALEEAIKRIKSKLEARQAGGDLVFPFSFFRPKVKSSRIVPLSDTPTDSDLSEKDVIDNAVTRLVSQLYPINPALARFVDLQRELVHIVASAFKASITVQNKSYSINPTAGSLGIAPLFPYAIKPTAATPSGYNLNTFDITTVANGDTYILGSATAFYKGQTTPDQTTWYLFLANGLIEVGSTPSAEQVKLISKEKQAISPIVPGAFAMQAPINDRTSGAPPMYLYNGVPAFYVDNQSDGVKLILRTRDAKPATIVPLGFVFYEYAFFPDLVNAA